MELMSDKGVTREAWDESTAFLLGGQEGSITGWSRGIGYIVIFLQIIGRGATASPPNDALLEKGYYAVLLRYTQVQFSGRSVRIEDFIFSERGLKHKRAMFLDCIFLEGFFNQPPFL